MGKSVTFSMRIDKETLAAIKAFAKRDRRSANNVISIVLGDYAREELAKIKATK